MSDRVGYRTSVVQTVTEPVLTDCYQPLYETQIQLYILQRTNYIERSGFEKQTALQLVRKFPSFYGIRRFITVFTTSRHWSLFWSQLNPLHQFPTLFVLSKLIVDPINTPYTWYYCRLATWYLSDVRHTGWWRKPKNCAIQAGIMGLIFKIILESSGMTSYSLLERQPRFTGTRCPCR